MGLTLRTSKSSWKMAQLMAWHITPLRVQSQAALTPLTAPSSRALPNS